MIMVAAFVGPAMIQDLSRHNDSFVAETARSTVGYDEVVTLRSTSDPSYATTPSARDWLWLRTFCFAACMLLLVSHVAGLIPASKR